MVVQLAQRRQKPRQNSINLQQANQARRDTGPRFNTKTIFTRYRDSHYKDKTVVRPCYLYNGNSYILYNENSYSYLYNGNSYTGKLASLYWNAPPEALVYIVNSSRRALCMKRQLNRWNCVAAVG